VSENPPSEPEQPRLPDLPPPTPPVDPEPEPGIDPAPPVPDPEPLGASGADATAAADEPSAPGQPAPPPPPAAPGATGTPAAEEPFGRPPSSAGRSKLPLLIGGLVVLALIVAGLFLVVRDDDDGGSPEQAVRDFFDASKAKDCDRLVELVVERSWSQNGTVTREKAVEQCTDEMESGPQLDTELKSVKTTSEKDDKAVVQVSYTLDDEAVDTEIDLVKEDGDWKIDSV